MFLLDNIILLCPKRLFGTAKFYTLSYYENSKQTRTSQIAFNYSSDIDFKDVLNLYKNCTAKSYSSLVIDQTL